MAVLSLSFQSTNLKKILWHWKKAGRSVFRKEVRKVRSEIVRGIERKWKSSGLGP
jgi:hypothetical protein